MKKDDIIFWFYILSWTIYYSQESLGLMGKATVLLAFLLPYSFLCFINVMKTKRMGNDYLKALGMLGIVCFLYGLQHYLFGSQFYSVAPSEYIKVYANSIFPIFGYYYILRKITLSERQLVVLILLFLAFAVWDYYTGRFNALMSHDSDEVTNNSTYRLLPLLSLVFLIKNDFVKYGVIVASLIFIVLGMKRGPILIGLVITAIIIFTTTQTEGTTKKKIIALVFLVVSAIFVYKKVSSFMESSFYFQERLEQTLEGDSSGRNDIYTTYFNHWLNNSNIFTFLFGNGADGTLHIFGVYAHNDWIEILIDLGLVGGLIYLWYIFSFFKYWRSMKNGNKSLYLCFGTLFLTCFMTSFFSMSINNMRVAIQFAIAYCLAEYSKDKIDIVTRFGKKLIKHT